MKIERHEDRIGLIPETQFEIDCLKVLKDRPIKSKQFQDAWEQTGPLYLNFQTEAEAWGR